MNTTDYHELLAASKDKLVLIAFTAKWSGSAEMLLHILDMAKDDLGEVVIGMIDVDAEEEVVKNLGISSVPTTLIVRNRVVVDLFTGPISRRNLMKKIKAVAI